MDVAAIMPCRGRAEQTVTNVKRLLATAGYEGWWRLILVCDGDQEVYDALSQSAREQPVPGGEVVRVIGPDGSGRFVQHGYWGALELGAMVYPNATHLVNLANDLLPGRHWLARGVAAYRARFGDGDGLMGFNDGLHGPEHSPHFLISRGLLERYGGWPVHYQHNFGDTELCRHAQQDGCYGKAAWAVLYHNHLENGAADDEVYRAGRETYEQDARLFEERRRLGWPGIK